MDHDAPTFGRWLQRRRRALYLTQRQLGVLVCCATTTIRKIEADQRRPSADVARRLASALQVPPAEQAAFLRFARGVRATSMALPADVKPVQPCSLHAPSELPIPLTPLIGRVAEIATLQGLLATEHVRLVTLTGPGGVGKTRLSLAVAAALRDAFAEGVVFVPLAPLDDPGRVLATIAHTLDVGELGGQPLLIVVKAHLRHRHLLLVLDNFEHVLAAAAIVTDLLSSAPGVRVLITSREVLHLHGEYEVAVAPLARPDLGSHDPGTLTEYASVRLFIERAVAVNADFRVTTENAPAVAEICARLDGLPLAIELAAARSKVLLPDALLRRLREGLDLLSGGARDLPIRQQTIRATIDWSYRLLTPAEQTLFARLAIFAGGWTPEAAAAVCDTSNTGYVTMLDRLQSLLDKSLLQRACGAQGEPRFTMLETLREYGRDRLEASGEAVMLRQRHAEYFLTFAEVGEAHLRGPREREWLERLEAEHDNLQSALRWLLEREETEAALRLSGSVRLYWQARGYLSEGRHWLEAALAVEDARSSAARMKALMGAGWFALYQQDYARADTCFAELLPLARDVGGVSAFGEALRGLGNVAVARGAYDVAETYFQDSLRETRSRGDRLDTALSLLELSRLADIRGDVLRATTLKQEVLACFREIGFTAAAAMLLGELGYLAHVRGDAVQAATLYQESLSLYRDVGWMFVINDALLGLATIAVEHGHEAAAARLWGAAEKLRGTRSLPANPDDVFALRVRAVPAERARLDEAAWAAAWAEGRAMTLDQAVSFALALPPPCMAAAPQSTITVSPVRVGAGPGVGTADGLTAREIEVLRLVAAGLTNRDVAERLLISPNTVNVHLTSIYRKLGVTSRSGATRRAIEQALV